MSKTVVITGGTTGIGKATALRFAKEGYIVIVTSRNETRRASFVEEFKTLGYKGEAYNVNVTNEEQVKQLIQNVVANHGSIDVLINNAGIAGEPAFFAKTSENNMREMVETNIMGPYYGMRYAIQEMLKAGKGSIVNLASIAGLNGVKLAGEYGATKHAVVGMTKGAAVEYADKGIRINAVAPAAVMTDILKDAINSGEVSEESLAAMQPMHRTGKVEDIANAIYFLASDEADYITGVTLPVDGGFTAL